MFSCYTCQITDIKEEEEEEAKEVEKDENRSCTIISIACLLRIALSSHRYTD
jgi:hypothetical protein